MALVDFDIYNVIGKGSYGTVYKVKRKADGQYYCMKQMNLGAMNPREQADVLNEVRVLAALDHPNIIRYYDSFIENYTLNIIMELAEGGNLCDRLARQRGVPLPEVTVWRYFLQILIGLEAMHSRKIVHRDLKSLNVLLDSQDRAKLGDFGVAHVMENTQDLMHSFVGTPYYLSPELCENRPYNDRSDIWALGCILYELCTLKHPFDAKNQGALILKIIKGTYAPISSRYSTPLNNIITACLTRDATHRPSANQLLNHPTIARRLAKLEGAPAPPPAEPVAAAAVAGSTGAAAPRPVVARPAATTGATPVRRPQRPSVDARHRPARRRNPADKRAVTPQTPSTPLRAGTTPIKRTPTAPATGPVLHTRERAVKRAAAKRVEQEPRVRRQWGEPRRKAAAADVAMVTRLGMGAPDSSDEEDRGNSGTIVHRPGGGANENDEARGVDGDDPGVDYEDDEHDDGDALDDAGDAGDGEGDEDEEWSWDGESDGEGGTTLHPDEPVIQWRVVNDGGGEESQREYFVSRESSLARAAESVRRSCADALGEQRLTQALEFLRQLATGEMPRRPAPTLPPQASTTAVAPGGGAIGARAMMLAVAEVQAESRDVAEEVEEDIASARIEEFLHELPEGRQGATLGELYRLVYLEEELRVCRANLSNP